MEADRSNERTRHQAKLVGCVSRQSHEAQLYPTSPRVPIKARVHVVFRVVAGVLESGEAALILLPFFVLAWLIAGRPRPREVLGEYDAFMLRCEIEDLQDEIQRRVNKRKRK